MKSNTIFFFCYIPFLFLLMDRDVSAQKQHVCTHLFLDVRESVRAISLHTRVLTVHLLENDTIRYCQAEESIASLNSKETQ